MLGSLLKDDPNTALVMFDSDHGGAVKDLFLQTIGEGASWLLRHPKMMGRIGCTSGGGVQGLCSLAKHRLSSNDSGRTLLSGHGRYRGGRLGVRFPQGDGSCAGKRQQV